MPSWLRRFALANPLTYLVEALRILMLPTETGLFPLGVDLTVLVGVALGPVAIETQLYPGMAQRTPAGTTRRIPTAPGAGTNEDDGGFPSGLARPERTIAVSYIPFVHHG